LPALSFDASAAIIREASASMPGGVSSNFRLGISPTPLVFSHGEGPYLFDADGNRLIDYYLGMGPMILGHTPPAVIEAARRQLERGLLFAGQTEVEFEAARLVCDLVPCAERVRFGSSGSEVVQAAIRLARAASGRRVILKFEGHYHGWLDNVFWSTSPALADAGASAAPNRVAGTTGQDPASGEAIEVLPWNDLALLEARLLRGDVAGVIMEPAMCNASVIAPARGYLEGVRALCTATKTVLIFDEVITGFRLSPGGAQQYFGVTPDLATFGKAIASGFPVAALAGSADLMDRFATGGVMHGGTYNAQPVCMAATVATLEAIADGQALGHIDASAERLSAGIETLLSQAGIVARVACLPGIFNIAFGVEGPVRDYRDALRADRPRYVAFTTALLRHGVRALERGTWFLSTEHTGPVIDQTMAAVEAAVADIATLA
jgi:glutamate-1-semialdehyde 2,1-aminomutase